MKNSTPKVTSHEIVDTLSAKASIKKNIAEDFLKQLFSIIEDSLLQGESVKIKNLGTFKLQWNEPRKSVNVQTGEEIILSGHNKVVFTPDEKLKDLVNAPFAHLEPVEVGADGKIIEPSVSDVTTTPIPTNEDAQKEYDPLKVFSDQAGEIMNIISEIQSLNSNTEVFVGNLDYENRIEYKQELAPETTDNQDDTPVEVEAHQDLLEANVDEIEEKVESEIESQMIITETQEDPLSKVESPEIEQSLAVSPSQTVIEGDTIQDIAPSVEELDEHKGKLVDVTPPPVVSGESMLNSVPPSPKRKNGLIITLTSLSVILILAVTSYFLFDSVSVFVNSIVGIPAKVEVPKAEPVLVKKVEKAVEVDTTVKVDSVIEDKNVVNAAVDSTQLLLDGPREYKEFIATERIKSGSRLAQMSLRYYGARDFWVYIYEANKDHIPDPDNISRGTMIKIPKLDSRLTDVSSAKCMEKAHALHNQYKKH